MGNTIQSSFAGEKKAFLTKLKSNPVFLLRHLKSLSGVAWKRAQSRKGAKKIFPGWLKDLKKPGTNHTMQACNAFARIPKRTLYSLDFPIATGKVLKSLHDNEDYLAKHRFINLFGQKQLPSDIEKWIISPPPKTDPAWETYSCCERIANLLTWISFIPENERHFTHQDAMITFLNDSMHWIYKRLEFYGARTNNHILNNARALVMAGVVLGNENAVNAGIRIFKMMLPILIQPNGFLRERSSHYQLVVLTWLLDAYHFLQFSQPDFLHDTITRMCEAASMICDDEGNLQVFIGDISPDASPQVTTLRLRTCYPDFWPAKSIRFSYDDWHIIKNKKNKIILNIPAGKFPLAYPTHGHNDITSFVWLYENHPVLVDSGRARYSKEPVAIWQKSAMGHSVPLVNHYAPLCESLVINGNWWPAPYANAFLSIKRPDASTIIITHDGFRRITPVELHRREITVFDSAISVSDYFAGSGEVIIYLLWQLHPSFNCFNKQTATLTNQQLAVSINVTPKFKKGWYSQEYTRAQTNLVLVTKWTVNLPFTATIRFEAKKCVV